MNWEVALLTLLGFTGLMIYMVLLWKFHLVIAKRFNDTAAFLVWMIGGAGVLVAGGAGVLAAGIASIRG